MSTEITNERLEKIKSMHSAEKICAYLATLPTAPDRVILPDLTEAEWAAIGRKVYYAEWLIRVGAEAQKSTEEGLPDTGADLTRKL